MSFCCFGQQRRAANKLHDDSSKCLPQPRIATYSMELAAKSKFMGISEEVMSEAPEIAPEEALTPNFYARSSPDLTRDIEQGPSPSLETTTKSVSSPQVTLDILMSANGSACGARPEFSGSSRLGFLAGVRFSSEFSASATLPKLQSTASRLNASHLPDDNEGDNGNMMESQTVPLPKLLHPDLGSPLRNKGSAPSGSDTGLDKSYHLNHSDSPLVKFDPEVAQRAASRAKTSFMIPSAPKGGFFYTTLPLVQEEDTEVNDSQPLA